MKNIDQCDFYKLKPEDLEKIDFNPFKKIGKDWFLVTAGDENSWNTMTAAWGFAGVMWGKKTLTTVIKSQRYTKSFVDNNEYFTASFFDEEYRPALSFCGAHSGRDCDKAKETGLIPIAIKDEGIAYGNPYSCDTTAFEQASMIIVCKKSYIQPMKPECFNVPENDAKWYADKDYHVQYIGEIVAAYVRK